jgi:heparanase
VSSGPVEDRAGVEVRKVQTMRRTAYGGWLPIVALAIFGMLTAGHDTHSASISVSLSTMGRKGTIDKYFQSYNIEILEITGGDFWKPYVKTADAAQTAANSGSNLPAGMNPGMYQYRPPINLANSRLRKLAAALSPAYVRVSGTWANTTYFYDFDGRPPKNLPAGFKGVLTRQQWKGVIEFSHAVNAKIVTSFATGVGTRDAGGVWTPKEASKLLGYTKSVGGDIAAAEFMNEPTAAAMGGAPTGYDAAAYGRDVAVFVPFVRKAAPDMIILGPGSVGEGGVFEMFAGMPFLKSEDLLKAAGPVFDVFSYHFYGAVSQRCANMGQSAMTTADAALSDEWLSRTNGVETFYAGLRDRFEPGRPLWITETADAACGGNPWASTFLDSFRYLNQLGSMAQRGVQVVAHNTLDASDYGLLDENTLIPRPNYWSALLWRKFMGTTVLDPVITPIPAVHVYAHCLRDTSGGVALLLINADRAKSRSITVPLPAERYTLTAKNLSSTYVQLNGKQLELGPDDALPTLQGVEVPSGEAILAPGSITFLAIPGARNAACRSEG